MQTQLGKTRQYGGITMMYQIGTIVEVKGAGNSSATAIGTIVNRDSHYVIFHTNVKGHNLDGTCNDGYGWMCSSNPMKLITQCPRECQSCDTKVVNHMCYECPYSKSWMIGEGWQRP